MEPTKRFYTSEREEWRAWLSENYDKEKEIWFVFPTKDSGEKSLSYNDAVEEALCFGWIDSTAKAADSMHGLRRFTPRREGSPYSRPNIERLIWLDGREMLMPEVKAAVAELVSTPYEFPKDIIDAIKENAAAWENYKGFTESYKRIRVAYIDAARHRPAEFEKRLRSFIRKTAENKLICGYGGIDKYYK